MNGLRILSRGVRAFLLCFTLSAVAEAGPQNGLSTSQATSSIPSQHDYWAVEDAKEREKLPLYKVLPAAKPDELTPPNAHPRPGTFVTWHRSHGDNGGMRYPALAKINRQNVTRLEQAWIYHSADGSNNLQCNPIIVREIMIAPTP